LVQDEPACIAVQPSFHYEPSYIKDGHLAPVSGAISMAEVKTPAPRPLSPHLQVYRWSWTMAMSVFHRVTGSALYLGIALFAVWIVALASGPRAFEQVQWFFGSPLGILILFGYTWVLMHHMLGGVRHLVWDFGHGMEPAERINMARFTLVGSIALTLVIWLVAFVLA
jgi:succinate dehydrogenase / fumarate reductase, cytochrome b subunit